MFLTLSNKAVDVMQLCTCPSAAIIRPDCWKLSLTPPLFGDTRVSKNGTFASFKGHQTVGLSVKFGASLIFRAAVEELSHRHQLRWECCGELQCFVQIGMEPAFVIFGMQDDRDRLGVDRPDQMRRRISVIASGQE